MASAPAPVGSGVDFDRLRRRRATSADARRQSARRPPSVDDRPVRDRLVGAAGGSASVDTATRARRHRRRSAVGVRHRLVGRRRPRRRVRRRPVLRRVLALGSAPARPEPPARSGRRLDVGLGPGSARPQTWARTPARTLPSGSDAGSTSASAVGVGTGRRTVGLSGRLVGHAASRQRRRVGDSASSADRRRRSLVVGASLDVSVSVVDGDSARRRQPASSAALVVGSLPRRQPSSSATGSAAASPSSAQRPRRRRSVDRQRPRQRPSAVGSAGLIGGRLVRGCLGLGGGLLDAAATPHGPDRVRRRTAALRGTGARRLVAAALSGLVALGAVSHPLPRCSTRAQRVRASLRA